MAKTVSSAPGGRGVRQRSIALILGSIVILLIIMTVITSQQTDKIRKIMDDAAYQNMETMMQTISSTVSSTFASDQTYMQSLASTVTFAEGDIQTWVEKVETDTSKVRNLYYSDLESDTAYGKNNKTLTLSEYIFTEHKNGQVRSDAYMSETGEYVYLLREPVLENGETIGYLYGEFSMSRFYSLLPSNVTDVHDISLMEADTMKYIHIPARNGSGTHISYNVLKYQTDDPKLAAQIVSEVQEAIKNRQYYMRLLTLKRMEDGEMTGKDFVVFLWPIDDGEYYLSGVSKVDSLQSERISVLRTINLLVTLLAGVSIVILCMLLFFFGNIIYANKKNAIIQKRHNEELDDALHIARAANKSKSNFLSNMSHDIRTPMNAIIGYTTLLRKEADDPKKVREYTEKISSSGDYLLSLINDVLDMSKIESGKTTLNISMFHIRELVKEVEAIIRMQAEMKNQRFEVGIENMTHEYLMGDAMRIRQIVLNLLSNAVKYTPQGGRIRFTVEGIPQAKANIQKLRIVVQDTGYGMDEDYAKTIFEPFVRLNNSMTGKIQGTGLGLAITKNIIDLMGGTITVSSTLNKGSIFTVELEFPAADEPDSGVADPDAETEGEEFPLEGLHILAAEDNELNAEILTELLDMEGAVCKICGDGRKMVEEFERSEPGTYDLLLMDIQMPDMNGYEATKAIRAGSHPEAKTIPIVAMTANAFAEDVLEALQAGMDGHIAKPVDMVVLKKTISKVLKKRKKDDHR